MFSNGRKRAFTLIELLVVISIIALLVSILMPALQQARYQAQRVVCSNNVRQQAIVQHTYANDFNGKFPAHDDLMPHTVYQPDGTGYRSDVWEAYQKYVTDASIFVCPIIAKWGTFYEDPAWRTGVLSSSWYWFGWGREGRWFSDGNWITTPPGNRDGITIPYGWYANLTAYNNVLGTEFVFKNGEEPWPKTMSHATSQNGFISHVMIDAPHLGFYDYTHGASMDEQGGYGVLTQKDLGSFDNPLCFADGHVEVRQKTEAYERAEVSQTGGKHTGLYIFWY